MGKTRVDAALRGGTGSRINLPTKHHRRIFPGLKKVLLHLAIHPALIVCALAADQPQWGQAWSRNMVSGERGLPDAFDPETGTNIKWVAQLGTQTHSTPVVADGHVYIGTNNNEPRDPGQKGDRGVFMCFDEKDGKFLWQLVVPKRDEDKYFDWPEVGICSPATVDAGRVFTVTNRAEVVCLNARGLAHGNEGPFKDEGLHATPHSAPPPEFKPLPPATPAVSPGPTDADIVWLFDMPLSAGIWPHDNAHSSILVRGPHLYVNTGTGVDNTHKKIRTPDAPSLIVLDKATGRLLAREDEHIAPGIFHAAWSSPSLGVVGGRELIFHCGGDGIVRAFEPLPENASPGEVHTLKKVWQHDFDPSAPKEHGLDHVFVSNKKEGPSDFYGMPVFHDGKIYVAGGGDIWWGKLECWLKCLDAATGKELWSNPLNKHVMTTPAVKDGLVFIADTRNLHCVDAKTGEGLWTQELGGEIWASPLLADGKVYIGSRKGDFWIFAAGREKKVLSTIDLRSPVSATATAAGGVLYVATMKQLFAIRKTADSGVKK